MKMNTELKSPPTPFRSTLITIGLVSIFLVLIFSLKNYPDFVEEYYSRGIFPFVRRSFQFLFNYLPFSAGDILYIIIIILTTLGFFQLIRLLLKKQIKAAGLLFIRFLLKIEIGITVFYLLWALNYFRQPAIKRLNLDNQEYNLTQLITVTSMLIDSTNVSRSHLQAQDFNVTNKEIVEKAVQAVKTLSTFDPPIFTINPLAKPSLLSPLLNYLGTAGYYNPFTGEAQINNLMPVFTQPFVACHEMAHQVGFGAEDEANFAGFLAGKSSPDKLLKYSAYYLAAQEFMNEVWRTDSTAFKQMRERISPAVIDDLETERQYWTNYQGGAAKLSSIFYDNYLKVNKQPGGLKTYNKMINLSMAYYRKKGVIE